MKLGCGDRSEVGCTEPERPEDEVEANSENEDTVMLLDIGKTKAGTPVRLDRP